MDLLKNILAERQQDLAAELTRAVGFSKDQAERFVPDAGTEVLTALTQRPGDLDLANPTSAANVGSIIRGLDVAAIAGRAGISADQGKRGLTTLVPMLLGFFAKADTNGGLLSILQASGGASDALGTLKGLGGKLFG